MLKCNAGDVCKTAWEHPVVPNLLGEQFQKNFLLSLWSQKVCQL